MAGSDELIYRIKFEADEQSKQNVKKSLKELNEEQQKAGQSKLNEQLKESVKVGKEFTENNTKDIKILVELRKRIDSYRASLAELRKAKRDGIVLTDKQRAQETQLRGALKSASQAYRDNQKSLIANKTAVQGSASSYNQLAAETKRLEQQIRRLPLDQNNKQLKSWQAQIAQNKAKMKEFNATLGDHSMNVGNYAEALSTAASGLAIIQGPLGPLAGRLNSLNTTIQMSIPLIKAKVAAWGALKVAMLASGVGAIVVVLGTLIAALSKMQPVMDAVTKKWNQLAAVWGFAVDRIGALFGMNEKSNYSLWESIKVTGELADAQVELDEARIRSLPVIAQLEADIARLRKEAEDETNTHYERIEAMDKAIKKNEELAAIQQDLADQELENAERAADLARNERADNEKLAELEAESIRIKEEKHALEKRLLRRRTSIINSLATEEKQRRKNIQAIKDEVRALREASRDRIRLANEEGDRSLADTIMQRRIDRARKAGKEEEAIQLEVFQAGIEANREYKEALKEAEKEHGENIEKFRKDFLSQGQTDIVASNNAIIEADKIFEAEKTALLKKNEKERQAIRVEGLAKVNDIEEDNLDKQINISQQIEQLRKESAVRQMALEAQVKTQAHRELIILEAQQEQRRQDLLTDLREKGFSEEEAQRLSRGQAELEFEQSLQETKTAIREEGLQNRLALEQAYADLTFGALNTLFGDTKAVQVATAIVDTYVAANKALASAPPPLSTVRAAAAVAMGMANVRKILSTQVGDKNVGGGGSADSGGLSSSRGFDVMNEPQDGPVARQVAESSSSPQAEMNPTFIFEGDLDSEVMAIKVRKGNRTIDSKTLTTKSRA